MMMTVIMIVPMSMAVIVIVPMSMLVIVTVLINWFDSRGDGDLALRLRIEPAAQQQH